MPGRLLASFVRSSSPSPSPSRRNDNSSSSSSSSSRSKHLSSSPKRKKLLSHNPAIARPHTPPLPSSASASAASTTSSEGSTTERRLSFAMDHLIHLHRNRDHKEKRRSLGYSRSSGDWSSSHDSSSSLQTSGTLDVVIESPPLVMYGSPTHSSGALLSGRLRLSVNELPGEITLSTFRMQLISTIMAKKPVSKDCAACSTRTAELSKWEFLTEPILLKKGNHEFPFSYLLPGHLPATSTGSLGSIEYHLSAVAQTSSGEEIRFQSPLKVQRAILPGPDKASIRIFPPTNLTGRVVLPSVIHPMGKFPVSMTLSGVVESKSEDAATRWRLRKMMWRIEEHQKIISSPCGKHAHRLGGDGNKGILHQDTRIIGHNEEKNGWKTDFDTAGGEITMEFEAGVKLGCNPVCDVSANHHNRHHNNNNNGPDNSTTNQDSPINHLEVKHNLVIELIVAEEICSHKSTKLATPTGAARVLRMLFHLNLTERSGLGISWDEEMPPVYNDVPASPPGYTFGDGDFAIHRPSAAIEAYMGSPLQLPEYEELEAMERFGRLDLNSPTSQSRPGSSAGSANNAPPAPAASSPDAGAEFPPLAMQVSRSRGARITVDDLQTEPQQLSARQQRSGEEEEDDAAGDR
ncbi:hypothetical protein AJ80_06949 [Polytolypa hystricis UAMH7299]|uniref:LDB19 N-terminal domain-containing protein n=1 Tax=Polytolypa hystricis (strain UAMH7299) TaxID=1447883 RepID=A0A2B7XJH0_POLH7|nr:hypothetical protein AJ80_06949 [Polytolypa hystricis UAMH7299]